MSTLISATEANQRFSELLRRVQFGESFVVTSRGRPVARMEAVSDKRRETSEERAEGFRQLLELARKQPTRILDWKREDLYD